MEPALEEGPGLVPRGFVVEAMADQPDELTGQLRGVAETPRLSDRRLKRPFTLK